MATMLLCKGGSGTGSDPPHVAKPAPAPFPGLDRSFVGFLTSWIGPPTRGCI